MSERARRDRSRSSPGARRASAGRRRCCSPNTGQRCRSGGATARTGTRCSPSSRASVRPRQFVEIDFADATAIGPAVERTIAGFGHVDILVNNAAARSIERRLGLATLFDLDVENWDYVQAVNLRAPFQLIQAVGRHMVERGTGGRIVNVGSSAASQARNTSSHYAASKAGLESLTRTAAAQLGPHGINVNNVAPGLTRTAYRQRMGGDEAFQRVVSQGPMENLMHLVAEPEDVAAVILFLCLPASRQITGQTIHTSAGLIV